MSVYQITFEDESEIVEAENFSAAIIVWKRYMSEERNDHLFNDEPEQVVVLESGSVWR